MRRGNKEKLSWTPVRSGKLYCSSACGGGCTYAAFLKAIKNGDELAAHCGRGFTRHVWENLGWHFHAELVKNRLQISELSANTFHANLGGQHVASGRTPKAAIANVVRNIKTDIASLQALLKGLE
jgi:hypothetical protein